MATLHTSDALPLEALLGVIPSLPRPLLTRLTMRLIERLDEIDGDPDEEDATDLEDEGLSDRVRRHARQFGPGCTTSDAGGGNVEDEGEPAEYEDAGGCGDHGADQREIRWRGGSFRIE